MPPDTRSCRSGGRWLARSLARVASPVDPATLSETPDAPSDASARSIALDDRERFVVFGQPATLERGLRTRSRASASNTTRSGGRHARCHSTADSSMPPAKNPSPTEQGEPQRTPQRPRPQRTGDAGRDQNVGENEWRIRKQKAGGGAGENAERWNSRDAAHGTRLLQAADRARRAKDTKETKDTKVRATGAYPLCPL